MYRSLRCDRYCYELASAYSRKLRHCFIKSAFKCGVEGTFSSEMCNVMGPRKERWAKGGPLDDLLSNPGHGDLTGHELGMLNNETEPS